MRESAAIVSLLLLVLPAVAQKKPELNTLVTKARFVMVTTPYADDPRRAPADDLRAVGDVEQALQKWGRYQLTYRRDQADLLIVVRKGRLASLMQGVGIGGGRAQVGAKPPSRTDVTTGAEVGDPQDTLIVYDARLGAGSPPLWRGRMSGGLNAPALRLVQQLRQEVEEPGKP